MASNNLKTDNHPVEKEINWELCILCQKKKDEALTCPLLSRRTDINVGSGYSSLVEALIQFEVLGELPQTLKLQKFKVESENIVETFLKFKASWHKSCRSQYSKEKLLRVQKRINLGESSATSYCPPAKRRTTSTESACFFCDKIDTKEKLRQASTFDLDSKVRSLALKLQDTAILAKLSAGDMIAIEAKYHVQCLIKFYNRDRQTLNPSDNMSHSMVFAELVSYIQDCNSDSTLSPVFKLAELAKLYDSRLQQFGKQEKVHSTRLKERLLTHFPNLHAYPKGRDIILAFNDNIGQALLDSCDNNNDDNALCLAKAAKILRNYIFQENNYKFNGSFPNDCQVNSVPSSLLEFVNMILEGPNIKNHGSKANKAATSITQLIKFNAIKRKRDEKTQITRHSKLQETPLPIYIGLLIHAKTRKRDLVDTLFDLGISISYDRVLQLSSEVADSVCEYYHETGIVCPPSLCGNLFTTSAVDNIDHNPSSTTANDSFHGTGISIFQHTDEHKKGVVLKSITVENKTGTKPLKPLPETYTHIEPVKLKLDYILPPLSNMYVIKKNADIVETERQQEYKWLKHVLRNTHNDNKEIDQTDLDEEDMQSDNRYISWAAYHSDQKTHLPEMKSFGALLPLFPDSAHSEATILHSMKVVKKCTDYLNPGQTPVITCDQPLFALAKTIQWKLPDSFGENKYVVVLGGLHIEMCFLKVLGQWLQSSGWTDALVESKVATAGKADSFIHASHVSRTRYAHQVTAASLYILQQYAYEEYCNHSTTEIVPELSEWCQNEQHKDPQFAFWSLTLELELNILMYIRSLRMSNFELYIQSLVELMPWLFALDRTNYARWLSVHIRDMMDLPNIHPEVYKEFKNGKFTVAKTKKKFSKIPIDQAHEQNNAVVKGTGGAVGLTENPSALLRWMVAGPEVSRIISEFDSLINEETGDSLHHDQVPSVQARFDEHVKALVTTINEFGNPFLGGSNDLVSLMGNQFADKSVVNTVRQVKEIGEKQYNKFVQERIIDRQKKLDDVLPRNKLPLFHTTPAKKIAKDKLKMVSIKNDSHLFSKLYIGTQNRDGNLDEFFSHENQAYPPSISEYGKLRFTSKSDLLQCLEKLSDTTTQPTEVSAAILDGAVIVQMLKPGTAKCFNEYSKNIFLPFISLQMQKVNRLDLVWDIYLMNSLKSSTRIKRGKGIRRRVTPSGKLPQNWTSFLHEDENKTELFRFLSNEVSELQTNKELVVTIDNEVLCIPYRNDTHLISPCSQEEADTRLLLHVQDASVTHKKVMIRSVDTDVVVIAIAMYHALQVEELWIQFGAGKNLRYLPIHTFAEILGPDKSRGLLAFHSFTGCDTVSGFLGKGKKTAWDTWKICPDSTAAFNEMLSCPEALSAETMSALERFVVLVYDRTSNEEKVNVARKHLFTKKGRSLECIPPTYASLVQHIRRACYQSYIWAMSLVPSPELPDPANWGWINQDGLYSPLWTTIPEAAKSCFELIHCGCKKGCKSRCKCKSASLPCTALCVCDGDCSHND